MHVRKYNKCRLIMSRQLTLREACSQLGFVDELSIDDYDNNNENTEEFIRSEDGENEEEIAVGDEGDVEVFKKIGDNDTGYDDGVSSDENANADQSDEEDRLLTAYRAEAAFCTQTKRFQIEDDVETSLHKRLELLPPHKLNAKALNI